MFQGKLYLSTEGQIICEKRCAVLSYHCPSPYLSFRLKADSVTIAQCFHRCCHVLSNTLLSYRLNDPEEHVLLYLIYVNDFHSMFVAFRFNESMLLFVVVFQNYYYRTIDN